MSHEYRNQLDIRNNKKIDELLDEMPEFAEDYYSNMDAKRLSTNTILGYMYELKVFLNFVAVVVKKESIKDLVVGDLEKLSLKHIDSYTSKSESGIKLSDNATRRKLAVVKSIYRYFIAIGSIKKNPTLLAKGPKVREHAVIKLSDAQVTALLHVIRTQESLNSEFFITEHAKSYNERMIPRDIAIIMVLLGTGMRISELVGLNMSDVDTSDPEKYYLHIIRKGADEDKVRIMGAVYNALENYIKSSRPTLVDSTLENALFVSTQGKRMSVNAVQKMVEKYCRLANLPDNISPHKMRATFATKVYAETKDIYAIKDALHHKTIDTAKHYISDKEARIDAAAEAAMKLFE